MKIETNRTINGLIILVLIFFAIALLVSCNDNDSGSTARLEVRLTDAPGSFEEVNVDVQEVQVNSQDDSDNDSGWQSLTVNKGIYDLKKLTNGIDTLLGSANLPAGKIAQIRLVLGSNNTVKIGGQPYPLTTPSAQQSGLKVQIHQDLKEGITYRVLLDFDAAQSIVVRGNGEFNLKPVIRAITEAVDGAIKGTVHPPEADPTVYAIMGNDTTSTSIDTTSGAFLVRGLAPGTYKVIFNPGVAYQVREISNVAVVTGQVADVGVVEISEQ